MGGLRREFARLITEQRNNLPFRKKVARKFDKIIHISSSLCRLPRSQFKFKNVKLREEG